MKTTIELPDPLFAQARRYADAHNMSMKALIEQGLRTVMAEKKAAKPFKLRDGSVSGQGLSPTWRDAGWEQMRDALYGPGEGRGA